MSQLTSKLDSLLQEAKRAVQRSPRAKQRNTQDGQQPAEHLLSASPFGLGSKTHSIAINADEEEEVADTLQTGVMKTCSSDVQGQQEQLSRELEQQLTAAKEQCSLKQQEVEVLQAQVQRLCAFVESSVANEAESGAGGREAALKQQVSDMRAQLSQATAELHECRTQLHAALDSAQQLQSLLAATSAAKAGVERRAGALKLLLAEQVGENAGLVQGLQLCQEGLEAACLQLEQAEAQQAAARVEIACREEDCAAMRSALHLMNSQLAQLTGQQQHQQQQQEPDHQVHDSSPTSSEQQQAHEQQQQQQQEQEQVIAQQKHELAKQQQELAAAAQQLQEVCSLLALKNDSLSHFTRHTSMLEIQLTAVKQQLQEAHSRQESCLPAALPCADEAVGRCSMGQAPSSTPAAGHAAPAPAGISTASSGQLGGSIDQQSSTPPAHCCPSVTASPVAEQAEAAVAAGAGAGAGAGSSPRIAEQLSALGPIAKARGFMAQREAEALARLKEELRDRERAVKELTAEAGSASGQLHGLQTVLTAKTAQCNRLDAEARQLERQLKQAQAATAAEQEGLRQEVGVLSQRVAEVEGQLAAAQQREQEQQAQLVAVTAKLSQVLEALVQDAESVQKHQPQLHAQYVQDAPAALADACSSTPGATSLAAGTADVAALATLAAAQQALAGSSAAALAVMTTAGKSSTAAGSAAGRPGDPGAPPSGGGGLFGGGKLLDALLGRRASLGLADVDKLTGHSSSSSRRTSQECSRAVLTPRGAAPAAGLLGFSRAASHDAATPVACSGGGCSTQLSSCCQVPPQVQGSCRQQLAGAADGAELAMKGRDGTCLQATAESCGGCPAVAAAQTCSDGTASAAVPLPAAAATGVTMAKASSLLPGPVAEEFDAVVELLHKLGPDSNVVKQ